MIHNLKCSPFLNKLSYSALQGMEGEQYVEYAVMLGVSGVEQIEENSSQITGKRKDFSINF